MLGTYCILITSTRETILMILVVVTTLLNKEAADH
jgi:hypothetical protein